MYSTTAHICTIVVPRTSLLSLSQEAKPYRRLLRCVRKSFLPSEKNPRCSLYFRSTTEMLEARKTQIESGTWLIHPFSTFRLYYEMYMAVFFFLALIYMPLYSGFHESFHSEMVTNFFMCLLCWFDIFMNFVTGYPLAEEERIVMELKSIAKRYVISIYFICDLLSSLPECVMFISNDYHFFLGFLKVIRLNTFIRYMDRTMTYFKLRRTSFSVGKLFLVLVIVTHYAACLSFIVHQVLVTAGFFYVDAFNMTDFPSLYSLHVYKGASRLLGVERPSAQRMDWPFFLCIMLGYCAGKILTTFFIVALIDLLKGGDSLEHKFFAMMEEVEAFMAARKFPESLRGRVRENYFYRYRQRYFKESSITRFLSENLKKEINYHSCRKLVRGVEVFQNLPQLVVEEILKHLKPQIYLSGDVIIRAGLDADCMYFLSSGTVVVSSPSGKEICHLEDGAYFGEIALVKNDQKRCANVAALEICEIYILDAASFKKCIKPNKEVYEILQKEAKRRYDMTQEIEAEFFEEFASKFMKN